MPCDPIQLPGGFGAIICGGRRRRLDPCVYCGRASSRLCDFKLTVDESGQPIAHRKTCDRAMCDHCAFRPPGTELDYCRAHVALLSQAATS